MNNTGPQGGGGALFGSENVRIRGAGWIFTPKKSPPAQGAYVFHFLPQKLFCALLTPLRGPTAIRLGHNSMDGACASTFVKLSVNLTNVRIHFQKEPLPPGGATFSISTPKYFFVLYFHPTGGPPPGGWGLAL